MLGASDIVTYYQVPEVFTMTKPRILLNSSSVSGAPLQQFVVAAAKYIRVHMTRQAHLYNTNSFI